MNAIGPVKQFLRFPKSGKFHLLKTGLTDQDVKSLFSHAKAEQDKLNPIPTPTGVVLGPVASPANVEFSEVREVHPAITADGAQVQVHTSLFIRSFPSSPSLAPKSGLIEYVFGTILMIECRVQASLTQPEQSYLFIHRENAIDPMKFGIANSVEPIELAPFLEQFFKPSVSSSGSRSARIEQMSMSYMASSQNEVRRKTVEAHDVESTTSSLGLHRTIAGSMTVLRPAGTKNYPVSLTPHRQSLRVGSSRISYDAIIAWAAKIAVGFRNTKHVSKVSSTFLAQMAQPLMDLVSKAPASVLIERHALADAISIFEKETGRSWTAASKTPAGWSLDDVLESLGEPIQLDPTPIDSSGNKITMVPLPKEVYYRPSVALPHFLSTDTLKVKVSSRTCRVQLPKGAGKFVHPKVGEPAVELSEVLNDTQSFRVVFDHGRALYCSEGAFRSSNITLAIDQLTHIFKPVKSLGKVVSEKGVVAPSSKAFSLDSCFHFIETDSLITDPTSILLCDDAKDEWCDFLEIDAKQPRMRWFHAKVQGVETPASIAARAAASKTSNKKVPAVYQPVAGSSSLSASNLQEVIGQAMKNLAKLRLDSGDPSFVTRSKRWINETCTLPSKSDIRRNRRPIHSHFGVKDISVKFDELSDDPLAVLEVAIVVPNYSAKVLIHEMNNISAGKAQQNVVQAFWLLSGFMHACLEVGARPLVFIQE
jgi:hypothetical protein